MYLDVWNLLIEINLLSPLKLIFHFLFQRHRLHPYQQVHKRKYAISIAKQLQLFFSGEILDFFEEDMYPAALKYCSTIASEGSTHAIR